MTLLLIPALSRADLPYSDQIPANALVAIGISDTGTAWSQGQALPLVKAVQDFFKTPALAANPGLQKFNLERKKLEQQLGFPVTGQVFCQQIFSSLTLFSVPSATDREHPQTMLILGVKDGAKAAKLLDVFDAMNSQETSPTQAAASAPTAAPKKFEKIDIEGVKVSHVPSESDAANDELFYAIAGNRMVVASNKPAMADLIKAQPAATPITKEPTFAQYTGLLPWPGAVVTGWIDVGQLNQLGQAGAMLGAMPAVAGSQKVAFTMEMDGSNVLGRVVSAAEQGLPPQVAPRQLLGVSQVPPTPLLAITDGQFIPEKAAEQLAQLMAKAGMAQGGDSPMADFEKTTGISVQNELVPALGNEMTFSLNNLQFNLAQAPLPFTLDVTLSAEVRDKAKMQQVLQKLEAMIEKYAAQSAQGQADPAATPATPPPAPKFTTVTQGPVTVRAIDLGMPGLSPCYALHDRYVIFSLSQQTLADTLKRLAGQMPSVQTSPTFNTLKTQAGTDKITTFGLVGVGQLIQGALAPMLPLVMQRVPPEQQAVVSQFVTQVLPHLSNVAMLETQKGETTLSFFRVSMQ